MKILQLSAKYPPVIDGIGDYTRALSTALVERGHELTVLTTEKGPAPEQTPGIAVHAVPHRWDHLAEHIASIEHDLLMIQYNPFAFGRRGYCSGLVSGLRRAKALLGRRILVNFHEVYTDDPRLADRIMRIWQAFFTRRLARLADIRTCSTENYTTVLRRWGCPATTIPVGSNLPEPTASRAITGAGPLRIGTFGSAHPSRHPEWIARALAELRASGIQFEFLFVGAGGDAPIEAFKGMPYRSTGSVGPREASAHLSTLDLFLSPFSDGLSLRRGSVAAALQHQIPVVSNFGMRTDRILAKVDGEALILARNMDDFIASTTALASDPRRREQVAGEGRAFYERHLSWNRIASQVLDLLPEEVLAKSSPHVD
jgi:glycosyltransferase involved in cell wall biosynthesis